MRSPKEIEYAYIGCIFDSPAKGIADAFEVGTNQNWFSDITCRLVWAAVESLKKRMAIAKIKPLVIIQEATNLASKKKSPFAGQKIDVSFIDEAKRFRETAPEDEELTIESYAAVLRDAAIGRGVGSIVEKTLKGDFSSKTDMMMSLTRQIRELQSAEGMDAEINIHDLLVQYQQQLDTAYEEVNVKHNFSFLMGIPYPWDALSELTDGMGPGLHILAARQSVGKTSFAMDCVNFWCELGYKVAIDCLDMAVTELIKRPISTLSGVSFKKMKKGQTTPEEQYQARLAFQKVEEWGKRGLLTLTVEYNVDKLKSWAENRRAAGKLDILVVDYAQKFVMNGKSEYERVTYAVNTLKALANESLIPVVLLAQLNRGNTQGDQAGRDPEATDLKGSSELEQAATTVMLLNKKKELNNRWRVEPPEQFSFHTGNEFWDAKRNRSYAAVNLNLAKAQNGETGDIPFVTLQDCFRWYVGDEEETKDAQFAKIQADRRILEEPSLTAAANGAVVYPLHWESKCATVFGMLGKELPEDIRAKLSKYDIARYDTLVAEREKRLEIARMARATPTASEEDEPPPSMTRIAETSADADGGNGSEGLASSIEQANSEAENGSAEMPDEEFDDSPNW